MPFKIVRNDITRIKADAIVNTANPAPVFGRGTDTAIYKAAGADKLLAERRKLGKLQIGEAAVTPAFALEAKYIIHTVGPRWRGGNHGEADMLTRCYDNCLRLALSHGCKSVAFPLISTGAYGFPKGDALQIAMSACSYFLATEEMVIYLVVFDKESFRFSKKLFADIDAYIDQHYVDGRTAEEYAENFVADGIPSRADEPSNLPGKISESAAAYNASLSVGKTAAFRGKTSTFADRTAMPMRGMPVPSLGMEKAKSQRSLGDIVTQTGETFQQRLFRLIGNERKDSDIYNKVGMDRKLFSKIRCNENYRPKKKTVLALAIALKLNLDETKDLLARAGFALSPCDIFDLVLQYFIEEGNYDVDVINDALYEYGQPVLGSSEK